MPATVRYIEPHRRSERDLQVRLARNFIARAAETLSELGENENRVAWVLEECIELIDSLPSCSEKVVRKF